MRRGLAWLGGALGLAALWRFLRQEQAPPPQSVPAADPAAELRAKLDEAREAADDRDEYDAAEGQAIDTVGAEAEPAGAPASEPEPEQQPVPPRSLEERRRAIHEKAQQALGEMRSPDADE